METDKGERLLYLGADEAVPRRVLRSLFWQKTDHALLQLFRYTCVGGIAFLVDISSLFVLTEYSGVYYLVSAAIAFLIGLITNYSASVIWVFSRRGIQSRFLEFVAFSLIGLVGLGLNEFFLWLFTEKMAIHYLFSKIISAVLVYLFNFSFRKFMLFR
jgi:putative flippase GtrA